ncbi:MAG: hypothetical protein F2842_06080 [Actinobacteria bacterium]|uniref:Unannotated protein n=1 Tax=freshwater metagenome TaxID=449393 RepID=A0A6J7JWE6_9ZZZZ|nr:hypothetical protein [Actinomycetota bacterium]MSW41761.1 hypothetical protein [Actinomycetota bacterium]
MVTLHTPSARRAPRIPSGEVLRPMLVLLVALFLTLSVLVGLSSVLAQWA